MAETFYKYIGCSDCQQQWRFRCPLCKEKGNKWKDENGHHVPAHQLSKTNKNILNNTTKDYAVLVDERIITPPPTKKEKIVLQHKEKPIKIKPEQPQPITWENFFIATKGNFTETSEVPDGYVSFFKSKGSEYFINESKTYLVRESDHWGFGIRYCNWYLKGYNKIHCGNWQKIHGRLKRIGIIKISDLTPSYIVKKTYQHQEFIPTQFDL